MREIGTMVSALDPNNLFNQRFKGVFFHWHSSFSNTLSCDSVIDGAFFSQSDLQMPEKEMSHYTSEDVMMPAHKLAHFVVVHAQLAFGFLETLFDRPS